MCVCGGEESEILKNSEINRTVGCSPVGASVFGADVKCCRSS